MTTLAGAEQRALTADMHRRKVTHEAGHAVAAVARGGRVRDFQAPFDDFTAGPAAVDEPFVTHHTPVAHRPFVTYAGLWATARWLVEHEPDVDDMREAVDYAIADHGTGPDPDAEKLCAAGVDLDARHDDWDGELEGLWPAIVAVADHFIDNGGIDNAGIAAVLQGRAA